ncbi:MAG: photosystem II complex extrinsic protein PsbU [Cyanobacteria bacterium P01_A01_bin.105]
MKGFFSLIAALGLVLSALFVPSAAYALPTTGLAPLLANAGGVDDLRNNIDDKLSTEYGFKIDVNNTNVAAFAKYRGLYPTIGGKIVKNAPYDSLDEVLSIPGLSEIERKRIESNMDNFTISDPVPALVEGADRFNNGVYK